MTSQLAPVPGVGTPRVHYQGRALVTDVKVSADNYPYLAAHPRDGAVVFPAVFLLEAMAQTAAQLSSADRLPVFENAEFHQPIVIAADGSSVIRIAARSWQDRVDVTIRGSETNFRTDHVHATLCYTDAWPPATRMRRPVSQGTRVPLDPATDLYGEILSRGRHLQRVLGYRGLTARSCVAEISTRADSRQPCSFPAGILGDPGTRDAFLDAIQGCVPEARLIPVSVDRLYPAGTFGPDDPADDAGLVILYAVERERHGSTYLYDLDVHAPCGRLIERWQGLRLVAGPESGGSGPWVPTLLGPYLERHLAGITGDKPTCIVESDAGGRDSRRGQVTAAIRRMLGRPALIWHRDDGRPEVAEEGIYISAAHGAGVMLAVTSTGPIGCDARAVHERAPQEWRELLGADQFELAERIRRDRGEPPSLAATRVWSAAECLRKAGKAGAPVTLSPARPDGWVRLGSGKAQITTFPARLRDVTHPVVFTILMEGRHNDPLLRIPPCRRIRRDQSRRKRVPRQLHALGRPLPRDVPARARIERACWAPWQPEVHHRGGGVRALGWNTCLRGAIHQDAPRGADPHQDRLGIRLRTRQ